MANQKFYIVKFVYYILDLCPKYIKEVQIKKNLIFIKIKNEHIQNFIFLFKNHISFKFEQLIDITAVDYPERKDRFEVIYSLLSLTFNMRVLIVVDLHQNTPIKTITNIYPSANWYEREVWDMFGIFFINHKDLRRILTDYGFEGFPFRKDFPQTGFMEVRYDDQKKHVLYEPLEMAQEYRFFDFNTAWLQVK